MLLALDCITQDQMLVLVDMDVFPSSIDFELVILLDNAADLVSNPDLNQALPMVAVFGMTHLLDHKFWVV